MAISEGLIEETLFELMRKASISLPLDVQNALKAGYAREESVTAKGQLMSILDNCRKMCIRDSASASSRADGISFGAEDFTLDLGTSRTRDGMELAFARASVALAAGAAKVVAIDTVYSDLNDEEGLSRECRVCLLYTSRCV